MNNMQPEFDIYLLSLVVSKAAGWVIALRTPGKKWEIGWGLLHCTTGAPVERAA